LFIRVKVNRENTDMPVEKKANVQELVEKAWNAGKVRLTRIHGNDRSAGRLIGTPEIRDVILYGSREEDQDTDKGTHWVYAIRNQDVDGSDIRIMFDVEAYPDVVIVTVMHVYPSVGL
jgi:hypothetical protein